MKKYLSIFILFLVFGFFVIHNVQAVGTSNTQVSTQNNTGLSTNNVQVQNVAINNPDTNKDGLVNTLDANIVISNFNTSCTTTYTSNSQSASCKADVNHDGIVNQTDLDIVLDNWTPTVPASNSPKKPSAPTPTDVATMESTINSATNMTSAQKDDAKTSTANAGSSGSSGGGSASSNTQTSTNKTQSGGGSVGQGNFVFNDVINRFGVANNRLAQILERINSRITIIESQGKKIPAEATKALSQAKISIGIVQKNLIDLPANFISAQRATNPVEKLNNLLNVKKQILSSSAQLSNALANLQIAVSYIKTVAGM